MRCKIKYTHPKNGCLYYFVDFRSDGDELRPVGCFSYRKHQATVFETKFDANKVARYLTSIGCDYVKVFPA